MSKLNSQKNRNHFLLNTSVRFLMFSHLLLFTAQFLHSTLLFVEEFTSLSLKTREPVSDYA